MDRWVGKVAVVTGASAGIGEAITKALVQSGLHVVGLARRKTKLESLKESLAGEKGKLYPYECDVANEQNVKDAFLWIKNTLGGVDALVNNAGFGIPGSMIDLEAEKMKGVFDVNVMGLIYCTQQAVRIMREGNIEGTIININSIQGHRVHIFPGIDFNVYPASKHAVTGLVEALQYELADRKLNVRVTSLSPGYVLTDIMTANDITLDLNQYVHLEPEDIANAVTFILSTPQRVQITELTIRPLGETF